MSNTYTTTEEKALVLLGRGFSTSIVASALGVTDSAISQLLADSDFADKVKAMKFANLEEVAELDSTYNEIETNLLSKLKNLVPLINKPREVLSAINVINGAKRRGTPMAESGMANAQVVNITLPQVIHHTYITNGNNQVTEILNEQGETTSLVTLQTSRLDQLARQATSKRLGKLPDPEPTQERSGESSSGQRTSALANSL